MKQTKGALRGASKPQVKSAVHQHESKMHKGEKKTDIKLEKK